MVLQLLKVNSILQHGKKNNGDPPFVLLQAFIFPYINLLWLGSILMGMGTLLAVWKRVYRAINENKK
jgi:cytochrome c biogenesis factor